MKMIQLYNRHLPNMFIDSMYGRITYWIFLRKEQERLEGLGRKTELKGGYSKNRGRDTECYLKVNKIS